MSETVEECDLHVEPEVIPTRNYTGADEQNEWWYLKRYHQDFKSCYYSHNPRFYGNKEDFRTRRSYFWGHKPHLKKALRTRIGNSDEIGAFVKLTNSYILVGDEENSENFCRNVKEDLPQIPVINTSLAGCRIIGRMCVGNKHGLIVPDAIYDTELAEIKDGLPDSVEVRTVEERLSALGNVVACNDSVALIHPDLDKETEEIIANTLQVEVFRHTLSNTPLVGSYCVLNNEGGLVCTDASNDFLENLSSLLQLPLMHGTVNSGNKILASGLAVNDSMGYAGMKTTSSEFKTIESAFQFDRGCVSH